MWCELAGTWVVVADCISCYQLISGVLSNGDTKGPNRSFFAILQYQQMYWAINFNVRSCSSKIDRHLKNFKHLS
jgi:hypothetical protein